MVYSEILGKAAIPNNDFVFELFLGPFVVLLFFAWICEKIIRGVWKKRVVTDFEVLVLKLFLQS